MFKWFFSYLFHLYLLHSISYPCISLRVCWTACLLFFFLPRMIYAGSFIYFHIMILDTNRPSATFSLFKWNRLSETSLVIFFILPLIWKWHLYLQNITLYMLNYMSISFMILFLIRMINERSFNFFHHKKIDFEKKRSHTTCVCF